MYCSFFSPSTMHIDLMKKVFHVHLVKKFTFTKIQFLMIMNQNYADGLNAFRAQNKLNFNEWIKYNVYSLRITTTSFIQVFCVVLFDTQCKIIYSNFVTLGVHLFHLKAFFICINNHNITFHIKYHLWFYLYLNKWCWLCDFCLKKSHRFKPIQWLHDTQTLWISWKA